MTKFITNCVQGCMLAALTKEVIQRFLPHLRACFDRHAPRNLSIPSPTPPAPLLQRCRTACRSEEKTRIAVGLVR